MQMNDLFPSASRMSLAESAFAALRQMIISLELHPGQMIYESDLTAMLEMSRTPIREAIKLLCAEGLTKVLPQRGSMVTKISERKVEEARFIRESLEVSGFRAIAASWDMTQRRYSDAYHTVKTILARQQDITKSQDAPLFFQYDEDFHRTLLELIGNQTLINVIFQMRGHLNRVRFLTLRDMNKSAHLVDEHIEIFDAIQLNDVLGVERLLRDHMGAISKEIVVIKEKYPQFFE